MTHEQQAYSDPAANSFASADKGEPPVGVPMRDANLITATKRFFKGYVKFSGRSSRAEFWWACLGMNILSLIPGIICTLGMIVSATRAVSARLDNLQPGEVAALPFLVLEVIIIAVLPWLIPLLVVSLAFALPGYASTWRRLQDAGFHGAFALLSLVGLSIVPLIMCILPTSPKALQFGPGAIPGPDGRFYEPDEFARAGFAQQGSGGQRYGQSEPYVQSPLPHGQQGYRQQGYGNQGYNPNFPPQQ